MAQDAVRSMLFLCTGNYYRSRYAECLFNAVAGKMRLPWAATSRGLALERGVNNVGPMAQSAIQALQALGVRGEPLTRPPLAVLAKDLEQAHWIVALKEAEHRPLVVERFPAWTDQVEYWHVEDAAGILPEIEREIMDLVARLLGGGRKRAEGPLPPLVGNTRSDAPASSKAKPVVRVGRETKGRKGKGVTIVSDLPLDEAGLRELGAQLKNRCGTGGTVKDGCIEIQGDQRQRLTALLEEMGFKVKQVGG